MQGITIRIKVAAGTVAAVSTDLWGCFLHLLLHLHLLLQPIYWEGVGHQCPMSSRRTGWYCKREVEGRTVCLHYCHSAAMNLLIEHHALPSVYVILGKDTKLLPIHDHCLIAYYNEGSFIWSLKKGPTDYYLSITLEHIKSLLFSRMCSIPLKTNGLFSGPCNSGITDNITSSEKVVL